MSLTVYHADWSMLTDEWRRSGKAMSIHHEGDVWPYLRPVHEEYLQSDDAGENLLASEWLTQVLAEMRPATAAPFEEFSRPVLFGDGCRFIRDLFPENHDEIVATFSPDTVQRLVATFDRLDFPAFAKASKSMTFASEAIPNGAALQAYLQAWGQLLRAAADQRKGVVICGD